MGNGSNSNESDPWEHHPRVVPGRRRRADGQEALPLIPEAEESSSASNSSPSDREPAPESGKARVFLGPTISSTPTDALAPISPAASAFGPAPRQAPAVPSAPFVSPSKQRRRRPSLVTIIGLVFASLFMFQCVFTNLNNDSDPAFDASSSSSDFAVEEPPFDVQGDPALQPVTAPFRGNLEIGTLVPLTGSDAKLAKAMSLAAEMAQQDINNSGGTRDTPVTVLLGDEGTHKPGVVAGDPTANELALETVNRFLASEVDAVVGGVGPGAEGPIIEMIVGRGAIHYRLEDPLVRGGWSPTESQLAFRGGSDQAIEVAQLVEQVRFDRAANIVVMVPIDFHSLEFARALEAGLRSVQSLESWEVVNYDAQSIAEDDPAADALAAAPDTIIILGGAERLESNINAINPRAVASDVGDPDLIPAPSDTPQILRALADVGITSSNTELRLTSAETNTQLGLRMGDDVALLDGVRGIRSDAEVPTAFRARLIALDPSLSSAPDYVFVRAAELYDGIVVVALAAHERGTDDTSRFAELIHGVSRNGKPCNSYGSCRAVLDQRTSIFDDTAIDYDGPSGTVEIDQRGRPVFGTGRVMEFDAAGQMTPVPDGELSVTTG